MSALSANSRAGAMAGPGGGGAGAAGAGRSTRVAITALAGSGRRAAWAQALILALFMTASLTAFQNRNVEGLNWSYPYFSGAAHLDPAAHWQYSVVGYERLRARPDTAQRSFDFEHEGNAGLRPYASNSKGYLFIVWAAKELFPWLTYIKAVILLQALAHIGLTLLVAFSFQRALWRALFALGYGANPLVAHVVTFPFYYFWQVIPTVVLILALRRRRRSAAALAAATAALALAFATRPSLLPLILFTAVLAIMTAEREQRRRHLLAAAGLLLLLGALHQPARPWHTLYVGLGAHGDDAELSDDQAYAVFKSRTSVTISTNLRDGNFYDPGVHGRYEAVVRDAYLRTARARPLLLLRNAAQNGAELFSFGHVIGHPVVNALSALTGLVVLGVLLWSGQYLLVGALAAYGAGFAWFFPPIPAYTFGAYMLLAYGILTALLHWRRPGEIGETARPGELLRRPRPFTRVRAQGA